MAITINGSGTITGVSAGGLPDNCITADDLASTLDLGSKTLTIPTNTTGLPAGGLEEVDMWELTSDLDCGALTNVIPTGWSRVNHDGFEKIGTGLSHSSGVFTFPSTGYYLINYYASFRQNGGATTDYIVSVIQTTTNGSTYSDAASNYTLINSTMTYQGLVVPFVFKVTDTSTHKLKLKVFPEGSIYLQGDTGVTFTSITTMKLGGVWWQT